ncbi:S1 family peptidase [Amycolatopsis samaneae]|uniref:S1 family peptidase n=1 Tax=Amycolatopsis samaneae TaxID=664691 RepID=A0ABW5GNG9_9PSEU
MKQSRRRATRALSVLAVATAAAALTAAPAHSLGTGEDDYGSDYVTTVDSGNGRSCSASLLAKRWIVTSASCFADDPANPSTVKAGAPTRPASTRIGRNTTFAPASWNGYDVDIVYLVPRADRDLVLAKLGEDVDMSQYAPVRLGTVAAKAGETLAVRGWGRTTDRWVPGSRQKGTMTVDGTTATTVAMSGTATICKGDSGGPTVRETASGPELVAVHSRSWQRGCLYETETRNGAVESRTDDIADWIHSFTDVP